MGRGPGDRLNSKILRYRITKMPSVYPVSVAEGLALGQGDAVMVDEPTDRCQSCQKPMPIFFIVLLCDDCIKKKNDEVNTTKILLKKKRDGQVAPYGKRDERAPSLATLCNPDEKDFFESISEFTTRRKQEALASAFEEAALFLAASFVRDPQGVHASCYRQAIERLQTESKRVYKNLDISNARQEIR